MKTLSSYRLIRHLNQWLFRSAYVKSLEQSNRDLEAAKRTLNEEILELKAAALQHAKNWQELKQEQERLAQAAITDPLTGLLNRRGEEFVIHPKMRAVQRQQEKRIFNISVIAIDLDHFKKVNDTHGHGAGDQVLLIVSELMHLVFRRDVDHLLRFGGEEFVIVSLHTTAREAGRLAEMLRRKIETDSRLALPITGQVTASFGLATVDTKNCNSAAALAAAYTIADTALYQAKRNGRNMVMVG